MSDTETKEEEKQAHMNQEETEYNATQFETIGPKITHKGARILYRILVIVMSITVPLNLFMIYFNGLLNKTLMLTFMSVVLAVILLFVLLHFLFRKKKRLRNILELFVVLPFLIFTVLIGSLMHDYIQFRTGFEDGNAVISTSIIVRKDSSYKKLSDLKGKKVGLIQHGNTEQVTLPKEFFKVEGVRVTYDERFGTVQTLIKGLLEGRVEAIALPSNYRSLYEDIPFVAESQSKIRVLDTYEKVMKINLEQKTAKDTSEPFNILLLGSDNPLQKGRTDGVNYDAIVLATVNPSTGKMAFTTIPRDTLITSTCTGGLDKVNHNGWSGRGADCMVTAIENFLSTKIAYYSIVDFSGLVEVIDDINGVRLCSDVEFDAENSVRGSGDKVHVPKGCSTMDGEQALAFARNRKKSSDATKRSQNHIVVLEAIMTKVISNGGLKDYKALVHVVANNTLNNFSQEQYSNFLESFTKLYRKSGNNVKPEHFQIEGQGIRFVSPSLGLNVYGYEPQKESVQRTSENIKRILKEK